MYQFDNPFMVVALALTILVWSLHFYLLRSYGKRSSAQPTPSLRFGN
jgi:hypothetical protein